MTTTNADDKAGDAKGVDPAILDPDEADRFAALIKPAWEEDSAVSASPLTAGATAASTTRNSDEGRPTAIDPIPNVDVGDTLPIDQPPVIDAEALVASVESSTSAGPPKSKGPPPAPSARPGSTRMGIGNDVETAALAAAAAAGEKSVGSTRLGIGDASGKTAAELAAEGVASLEQEPDEDLISTQARPVASVPPPPVTASAPPQPPRPAAGAVAARASASARLSDDDPIELPMNRGAGGSKMGVGIGIGLGIAAVTGLVMFLVMRPSGDAPKPAPTTVATTAPAKPAPKEPEITPPPIPAEEPAKPAEPAKEEPKPEPAKEEPKPEPAKEEPKPEPPKAPSGGSKPPSGGTKPPGGTAPKPPKGGIIRDAPF